MRFIKRIPSGVDKDIPVFEFAFGIEELKLFIGIAQTSQKNLPSCEDINPMKSRLNNMIKIMLRTLNEYKNETPNIKDENKNK